MDNKELEQLPNKDGEIEKGIAHIIVELIEYEHNAVVNKSLMKKTTGSINALSFASGEGLNEKTSPFDTYAQIIDGSAIIEIDGRERSVLGRRVDQHVSNSLTIRIQGTPALPPARHLGISGLVSADR